MQEENFVLKYYTKIENSAVAINDFEGLESQDCRKSEKSVELRCDISTDIAGKNILLIDDIYTPGVNIDEDAINALLNAGAKTVTFYAVGKV